MPSILGVRIVRRYICFAYVTESTFHFPKRSSMPLGIPSIKRHSFVLLSANIYIYIYIYIYMTWVYIYSFIYTHSHTRTHILLHSKQAFLICSCHAERHLTVQLGRLIFEFHVLYIVPLHLPSSNVPPPLPRPTKFFPVAWIAKHPRQICQTNQPFDFAKFVVVSFTVSC